MKEKGQELSDLVEINNGFRRIEVETKLPGDLRCILSKATEYGGATEGNATAICLNRGNPKDAKEMLESKDTKLLLGMTNDSWMMRIPLIDNVYIQAFPKMGGIAIGLQPHLFWNTDLPAACSNYEIIRHVCVYLRDKEVFVYNERENFDEFIERYEDKGLIKAIDLKTDMKILDEKYSLDTFSLFSKVAYKEFDKRMTALKRVVKEKDCFGFKDWEIKL